MPSHVGNTGELTEPDGSKWYFTIIDEVTRPQTYRTKAGVEQQKVLVLQRLKYDDENVEIRSGSYMLSKKADGTADWVWARYAQIAPPAEFAALFEEARGRGWF